MGTVRQTRGRQRIPMRLIQNQDDLYASFSKRRNGLFKKASELSTLCSADIGVLVFSPTDNPFSFFSPSMDSVVERCMHPNRPTRLAARAIDIHSRALVEDLNKRLDELVEEKLRLKQVDDRLDEADKAREIKAFWEETAVDALDKDQVRDWIAWFTNFKSQVHNHLQNQASTPSYLFANQSGRAGNLFGREAPNIDPFNSYLNLSCGGGVGGESSHPGSSSTHFFGGEAANINPFNINNLSGGGGGGGGESNNADSSTYFFGHGAANINPFNGNLNGGGESSTHCFGREAANINNLSAVGGGGESSNARSSNYFFGREVANINPFNGNLNLSGGAGNGGGGESSNAAGNSTHFFGREAANINPFNDNLNLSCGGASGGGGGESSNPGNTTHYFGSQAANVNPFNINPFSSNLNLSGGAGGVGESSSTHIFGREATNVNPFNSNLDLSGGGAGGGESSAYFYRPMPSRTFAGSSVGDVFSSPEQYVFTAQAPPPPPPTYLEQSGVEGSGAPMAAMNPYPQAAFTFPPDYPHAQNSYAAAETNEATTSNQYQLGN